MRQARARFVDVFSGAGGLSLGACRAGFELAGAIDVCPRAEAVHCVNFPRSKHILTDVGKLTGKDLLLTLGIQQGELDGLVGGPPCQGFSSMGHRRLGDTRNSLFGHFFRLVNEIRPRFYVAENVPGILDDSFDELRAAAIASVREYVNLPPVTLKASDFGAATSRERVFFIGYRRDKIDDVKVEDFTANGNNETVNVRSALRGLPRRIDPGWQSDKDGWHRITGYPPGRFGKKIAGDIPRGVGDKHAIERLKRDMLVSGCLGTRHTEDVVQRFSMLKPGEVDKVSRAARLSFDGLCPTLRSGTGPERGSFQALRPVHPTESRVITPREAARLQGFPDWFLFDSTKWHSFRLIGNSVSPILAEEILTVFWRKGRREAG